MTEPDVQALKLLELRAFLDGSADLKGHHFGDTWPTGKPFWWRKHLHLIDDVVASAAAQRAEIARLTSEAARWQANYNLCFAEVGRLSIREAEIEAGRSSLTAAAEDMRERAAKVADDAAAGRAEQMDSPYHQHDKMQIERWRIGKQQAEIVAAAIRALPVAQEGKP